MRRLFFTILISLLFTLSGSSVFAQTDGEVAKKYDISFPISELGNCQNLAECKAFCDQTKNYDACTNFAKKKGFYKEHKTSSSDEQILSKAREELGCNSMDECMAFCEKEENMERCMDFAAKHNMNGAGNAKQMRQVISTLKNTFDCASMSSCMEVCNSGDNMKRCMEIFQQAGFPVEINYSEESFNSEPPEVWCPKAGENCSWDGNQCTCYNPGDCGKYPGCTWTGKTCECSQTSTSTYQESSPSQEPPEVWCPKAGPGCQWTGKECICGSNGDTTQGFTPEPPEVWCPKAGTNCSWDGSQCICGTKDTTQQSTSQTTTPPADNPYTVQGGETIYKSECLSAGCRWSDNPNSCDCTGVGKDVQGVNTNQGLLQQLINLFTK